MAKRKQKRTRTKLAVPQLDRPTSREDLRAWVAKYAGLALPEKAVCPKHNTPLDYLDYTFFERGPTADTVVWACRGGGKTTLGAVATLLDLLFKSGIQVKILGGSREQSSRMYTYLCDMMARGFEGMVRGRMTGKGFALTNGSRVEILTQSQRAVRGTRVQKMRCDEVELFDPQVWSAAQLTTRSLYVEAEKSAGSAKGGATADTITGEPAVTNGPAKAGTTSPSRVRGAVEVFSTLHRPQGIMMQLVGAADDGAGGPDALAGAPAIATGEAATAGARRLFRWCIWDVIGRCQEEDRSCTGCVLAPGCLSHARTAEGFVPVEDVLALQARATRRLWDNELLCLPPVPEDPVFAAFSPALHVRPFPAMAATVTVDGRTLATEGVIAGIDYGWKKFVCLWIVRLRDGAARPGAWVVDEYVQGQRALAGHATAILARQAPAGPAVAYFADVAGRQHDAHTARTSEAILKSAGLAVRSRGMRIEDGIELVRGLLDPPETWGQSPAPRFFIDPRCTQTIAALTHYAQNGDKPIKDGIHDHLIDALRYALVGQGTGNGKVEMGSY